MSIDNKIQLKQFVMTINKILLLFTMFLLTSCSQKQLPVYPTNTVRISQTSFPDRIEKTHTPLIPAINPTILPTKSPNPTNTFTPTATSIPIPLLSFETKKILRNVVPQTYFNEECEYLSLRWGETKSQPGTIVVPVMYHSIRQEGKPVTDNLTVSHEYFQATMDHAKKLGFETITAQELSDFLYHNEKIPPLSMILIIDDRRPGVIRDHFLPVLEQNNWTVTLAYISGVANEREWNEMRELNSSNRLDMQAHGFYHNGNTYFTEFTSTDIIKEEVFSPIEAIQKNFGKRPIAFIWPGGNFTEESVAIVRTAEYELGFTAFSRGPIMFNWIPLGEQEIEMNDPLMVLPRYWSTTAYIALDEAVEIANQAKIFADENRLIEYNWYEDYCQAFPKLQTFDGQGY